MNLHSWDTVSLISHDLVNESLRHNPDSLISSFQFQTAEENGATVEVMGRFEAWQVVRGGSGNRIHLALPIAEGTYNRRSAQATVTHDLAGVVVTVEVLLSFLHEFPKAEVKLRMNFETKHGELPDDPAVICKAVAIPPDSTIGPASRLLIGSAIVQCLLAHQAEVTYAFATLRTQAEDRPKARHYAFLNVNPDGHAPAYLAVLGAMSAEQPKQVAIDPAVLAQPAPLVLVLSQDYVLRYLIMPQLTTLLGDGAKTAAFSIEEGKIVNKQPFALSAVQVGLVWYTPTAETLSIGVEDGVAQISLKGSCNVSPGIDIRFACTSINMITIDGGGVHFNPDPNPWTEHHLDVATWLEVVTALLLVVAPIAEAITVGVLMGVSAGVLQGLNAGQGVLQANQLNAGLAEWKDFQLQAVLSGEFDHHLVLRGR